MFRIIAHTSIRSKINVNMCTTTKEKEIRLTISWHPITKSLLEVAFAQIGKCLKQKYKPMVIIDN